MCPCVTASDRAAGAGPVSSGIHDEVFPRNQRKRGNEEDHWSLWVDRKTAGRIRMLFRLWTMEQMRNFFYFFWSGTGRRFTPEMSSRSVRSGTCQMVRNAVCVLPGWPGRTLTCCSLMSPPITWILRPLTHWQKQSMSLTAA